MDKEPQPPRSPNNYESLIKWRSMNAVRNVTQQTMSTIYLLSKGYNLSLDFDVEGITPNDIISKANEITNGNSKKIKKKPIYL